MNAIRRMVFTLAPVIGLGSAACENATSNSNSVDVGTTLNLDGTLNLLKFQLSSGSWQCLSVPGAYVMWKGADGSSTGYEFDADGSGPTTLSNNSDILPDTLTVHKHWGGQTGFGYQFVIRKGLSDYQFPAVRLDSIVGTESYWSVGWYNSGWLWMSIGTVNSDGEGAVRVSAWNEAPTCEPLNLLKFQRSGGSWECLSVPGDYVLWKGADSSSAGYEFDAGGSGPTTLSNNSDILPDTLTVHKHWGGQTGFGYQFVIRKALTDYQYPAVRLDSLVGTDSYWSVGWYNSGWLWQSIGTVNSDSEGAIRVSAWNVTPTCAL